MLTCSKCGHSFDQTHLFCPECGERAASNPNADPTQELTTLTRTVRTRVDGWDARIQALERGQLASMRLPMGVTGPGDGVPHDGGGFSSLGEFLHTLRWNRGDHRLMECETRAAMMGVGAEGGYLVPEAWSFELIQVVERESVVMPRARRFAADPAAPDGVTNFPALDYSKGRFAGVETYWFAEGATITASDAPAWRNVKLEPVGVGAIATVSDKLLRNASEAQATLQTLLAASLATKIDKACMSGNGVGKPLGVFGHPATLTVARASGGAVAYADLVGMFSRLRGAGKAGAVWVVSQTVLPSLMTMATGLGQLLWQPNAVSGLPGLLLGYPVAIDESAPTLGSLGDVQLLDLSFYGIKLGSALRIDMSNSTGTNFEKAMTSFRVIASIDGQPLLSEPWLLDDGTTQTSPFVQLL